MWPWEHVLFAYLVYSLYVHLREGEAPAGPPTVALVVGSLLPDAIDKPLAWEFGVMSSGYTIGHSVFVAIPLVTLVWALARYRNRDSLGTAFGLGYFLHLIGDVIPISIRRGELYYDHLLWPVVRSPGPELHGTLRDGIGYHFQRYAADLMSLDPSLMVAIQLAIGAGGFLLWAVDGFPGVNTVVHTGQRMFRRLLDGPRR